MKQQHRLQCINSSSLSIQSQLKSSITPNQIWQSIGLKVSTTLLQAHSEPQMVKKIMNEAIKCRYLIHVLDFTDEMMLYKVVSKTYNQHPFHIWQVQDSQLFLGIFFPESKLQILRALEEKKFKAKLSRLLLHTWQTKAIIWGSNECRPSNTSSSRHIHSWKQRVAHSTPWIWR